MYRGEGVAGSGLTDYDVRRCVNAINLQKLLFISRFLRFLPTPSSLEHSSLLSVFALPYVSASPLSSQPLPFSGSPLRFCFVSGRPFIEDRTYFKNIKSVPSLLERFVCSMISSSNHPYLPGLLFFFFYNDLQIFFSKGNSFEGKNINRNIYFSILSHLYHCDLTSARDHFNSTTRRDVGWNWNTAD